MIRSGRIPPVLNRICDAQVPTVLLVTYDGELLGASNVVVPSSAATNVPAPLLPKDPESLGTLLADIALEYRRLGQEYAVACPVSQDDDNDTNAHRHHHNAAPSSQLDCLLIQLEGGLAAATACEAIDCFVLAVARPETPPGLLRARLRSLADHIQASMSLLHEH